MHAHLSLLLACAAAFAPPRTLHRVPALFAETADDPALAAVIDADAALRIVTNNKMVAGWKPDRVKASFDAWVERCETREEALDLVSKNPGLLFCKPADVKDSPAGSVLQAKMIAGAMDFFRFGK